MLHEAYASGHYEIRGEPQTQRNPSQFDQSAACASQQEYIFLWQ